MPIPPAFHRRRLAVSLAVTAAVGAGLAPSAQAAAQVTVGAKCSVYWPGQGSQPIDVKLAGFTPGQQVRLELQVKGQTVSGVPSLTADATGAVETALSNWTSGLGTGPSKATAAKVVAFDVAAGAQLATTDLEVANVGVKVDSSAKAASTKRSWIVSGLSRLGGGKSYYAYYFKGSKLVGKQKLGKAAGNCGYLKASKVLIPFKRFGTFAIRIQAARTWQGKKLPWIGGSVTSYHVYK